MLGEALIEFSVRRDLVIRLRPSGSSRISSPVDLLSFSVKVIFTTSGSCEMPEYGEGEKVMFEVGAENVLTGESRVRIITVSRVSLRRLKNRRERVEIFS